MSFADTDATPVQTLGKIVQHSWTGPSLFNIARVIPDGIAVVRGDRIYMLTIGSPEYKATRLAVELENGRCSALSHAWRQTKRMVPDCEIMIVAAKHLKEAAVRAAIFYAENPNERPEVKRKEAAEKAKQGEAWQNGRNKRKDLALDDQVGFGKYGPKDGNPGLTIRQIIDQYPGWIHFMLDPEKGVGKEFLSQEARDYYYSRKNRKG